MGISHLASKDARLQQHLFDIGAHDYLRTIHNDLTIVCGLSLSLSYPLLPYHPIDLSLNLKERTTLQSAASTALQAVSVSEDDVQGILRQLSALLLPNAPSTSTSPVVLDSDALTRAFKLLYTLWIAIEMQVPGFRPSPSPNSSNGTFRDRLWHRLERQLQFW